MKQRLPALKPRRVLRALEGAGFFVHHASGSHYVLKHPEYPTLRVTIPFHTKDLKRRTLEKIIDQADLTIEKFLDLL